MNPLPRGMGTWCVGEGGPAEGGHKDYEMMMGNKSES